MRREDILNKDIKLLKLDSKVLCKLNNIDIYKVEDLWKCSRDYLKNNEFTNTDINIIKTKLQLVGLDLNRKVY